MEVAAGSASKSSVMRRPLLLLAFVALALLAAAVAPAATVADTVPAGGRSITYLGVTNDETDFAALGAGEAGYWFAHFGATQPADEASTRERAVDALPDWIAPFTHLDSPTAFGCTPAELADGCQPGFFFRTFSLDGPAHSKGGQPGWNRFTLPGGETGRSGAIVDPHTVNNTNNTVNRIQLRPGTPARFVVHVVTDNTNSDHDPIGQLRIRGNIGPGDFNLQVESSSSPKGCDLQFNRRADLYSFLVEGFQPGDYLKLQLRGGDSGASFAGLLFDESLPTITARPGSARSAC